MENSYSSQSRKSIEVVRMKEKMSRKRNLAMILYGYFNADTRVQRAAYLLEKHNYNVLLINTNDPNSPSTIDQNTSLISDISGSICLSYITVTCPFVSGNILRMFGA